jgi:hypothetical protein
MKTITINYDETTGHVTMDLDKSLNKDEVLTILHSAIPIAETAYSKLGVNKMLQKKLKEWSKEKPTTLVECFKAIDELKITAKERREFVNGAEEDVVSNSHHVMGAWLRNEWQLWDNTSPLHKFFNTMGIKHPDDMSTIILTSYHRLKNDKPVELRKQLEKYWQHWLEFEPALLPINIPETTPEYLEAFIEFNKKIINNESN